MVQQESGVMTTRYVSNSNRWWPADFVTLQSSSMLVFLYFKRPVGETGPLNNQDPFGTSEALQSKVGSRLALHRQVCTIFPARDGW